MEYCNAAFAAPAFPGRAGGIGGNGPTAKAHGAGTLLIVKRLQGGAALRVRHIANLLREVPSAAKLIHPHSG
jgi:hypothetical protein